MDKNSVRNNLFKFIDDDTIGCEVGVWKGDFSLQILNNIDVRKLHLVDPWKYQESYEKAWYGGNSADQKKMDEIFESVETKMASYIKNGKVVIHRGDSAEILKSFEDNYLDWIYIDGDHNYDAVLKDLILGTKKVKVGGLVICDDYVNTGWWGNDIIEAVDHMLKNNFLKSVKVIGNQIILQKI